jgi:hypothetical protein
VTAITLTTALDAPPAPKPAATRPGSQGRTTRARCHRSFTDEEIDSLIRTQSLFA